MAHRNVGLSPSCMLVLLRMLFSCSAAVLFGAVRSPLLRPITPQTTTPPQHQNRQNLHPRPTIHSLLQQNQNDCKLPNQGRLDLFCTTNVFFFFPFHCACVTSLRVSWLLSRAVFTSSFCDIGVAAHISPCLFMDFDLFPPSSRCLLTPSLPRSMVVCAEAPERRSGPPAAV